LAEAPQQGLTLTPDDAVLFLAREARHLFDRKGGRVIIGIAGGPGVGKSTIATDLVARLNEDAPGLAAYVPMDGFHMLHKKLEALGTVADKGMPHTFEGEAFAAFLGALKSSHSKMYGPGYSRAIEDVVQDAFMIAAEARILVTEGNYLLLESDPWSAVKPQLDLAVFVTLPRDIVRARLLRRHAEHGLFSEERNRQHVERVDLSNYDLVQRSRPRADIAIDLNSPT
jgi:pantothenate kinase